VYWNKEFTSTTESTKKPKVKDYKYSFEK